ncbi:RsmE family RNA methyltransferase [Holophaga foetida]|uniref:RsmE family RNA methyltransferase n=1 Tax=Holophaga foetida TaxID=35839 RepID=UPI0002474D8D|nr:RsmE family RNA methyltransferase [Holophaga foetida]
MSTPRLFLDLHLELEPGLTVPLDGAQAKHMNVLRLRTGDPLELVLPSGPWRADLTELHKDRALARLVAPLEDDREPPYPIHACIPLTAQLSLMDEMIPPLVELGITHIRPVIYARSQFDGKKTQARMERWQRILLSACEQSHRSRIPELHQPIPLETILNLDLPQKWVAYELQTGERNPTLQPAPIAFTSGPEGGITDQEFQALRQAGWQPLSFGKSILRAVTAPVALAGVVGWGAM